MCGINAIFAYARGAPPVDAGELCTIRDAMALRGPDGTGEWFSPTRNVGLGHRRLSIIDLRAIADQPMESADGTLALVFNGEIYNYKILRAELEQAGAVFRTESDTEVLLHLYAREGAEMVRKLRGMYAFALYDSKKRGMLLGRDPFGIKPLYYADDGKTIRIASQVKALLAGGSIDTTPEAAGHAGFFLWGNIPDPFTLYRGIRALPAGTTLWVDEHGLGAAKPFFSLARMLAAAGQAPADEGARRKLLRDALADSVTHHLIADVPVGVFLSAGLDSTTIAGLAVEGGAINLNTVTLGFREFAGTVNDETALAEQVARQRGTVHQTRWVPGREFAGERAALMHAMDQPSIDGVNTYFVAKATRAAGLKVALSGLGGDEIFAGYPGFRQIPKLVDTLKPLRCVPGLGRAVRQATASWIGKFTSPKYAGVIEYGPDWAGAYLLRRALFMPWELPNVMPAEMAVQGWRDLDTMGALRDTVAGIANPRLKVTALELSWYMRHQLLRDADWAGMAHSLEIRVPFVDPVLLERLAPLLAAGPVAPAKGDMADTLAVKLPDAVRHRAKTGFVVPVREWLAGEAGTTTALSERGLRGWARQVYRAQAASFTF